LLSKELYSKRSESRKIIIRNYNLIILSPSNLIGCPVVAESQARAAIERLGAGGFGLSVCGVDVQATKIDIWRRSGRVAVSQMSQIHELEYNGDWSVVLDEGGRERIG
jgi:hypothetical protein